MTVREAIIKELKRINSRGMFSAVVFYRGAIANDLNERVAYFEEYMEAEMYAESLEKAYSGFLLDHIIYLNGKQFASWFDSDDSSEYLDSEIPENWKPMISIP